MRTQEISLSTLDSQTRAARRRFSIIGTSPALLEAVLRAIKVAPIDLSVLVTGPSGAGKEFFPKIIHTFGARKHKKYIAVNCGAIPEGTIDSELFGHEKGAFTGAISARKGYFEEADGGTIFLDEVAELPLTTQARLLRVLETGEFLKVGSSSVQKTNVRIVAATNVDLLKAVEKGKFREDLYYRLSTIRIVVPSLHDRGEEDLRLLARKFAADFAEKYMTAPITFSDEAIHLMALYNWPGNVRQLKNVVDQLALFEAGSEISRNAILEALPGRRDVPTDLTFVAKTPTYEAEREMLWQLIYAMKAEINDLRQMQQAHENPVATVAPVEVGASSRLPLNKEVTLVKYPELDTASPLTALQQSERDVIIDALRKNGGNKRETARELDMSERTLYRKIRELEIN